MSRARRKRLKHITCAYCGVDALGTNEHVIPECLFPKTHKPTRADFIIIPVCKPCNEDKARDDSYFRDVLVADIACENNAMARRLWPAVFRSSRGNWSDFGRDASCKARMQSVHSPGGIYLGEHVSVPLSWRRLKRYFGFLARGLYWHEHQQCVPDSHIHEVYRLQPKDAEKFAKLAIATGKFKVITIGHGVFTVIQVMHASNASFSAVWLMEFYENISFNVVIGPKPDLDQMGSLNSPFF